MKYEERVRKQRKRKLAIMKKDKLIKRETE